MEPVPTYDAQTISVTIANRARQLGADLVGFASIDDLNRAPSFVFSQQISNKTEPTQANILRESSGCRISWPDGARTVLVVGVHHPEHAPELDWWFGQRDPPGNRLLIRIVKSLCAWIENQFKIGTVHLPYRIERGGIYLKDAAVLAGFGCIGKNNLLVTPGYGPRIRLRGLTLAIDLPSTGILDFDPCAECERWCQRACPQQALGEESAYAPASSRDLPARDGSYSRRLCNIQMEIDEDNAQEETIEGFEEVVELIKYCRRCEFSCPVGTTTSSGEK